MIGLHRYESVLLTRLLWKAAKLTVWTQLTNHFNWRTAKPLGPSSAPGCDEPTSLLIYYY